jgi:hypothetical protein
VAFVLPPVVVFVVSPFLALGVTTLLILWILDYPWSIAARGHQNTAA